MSSAPTLAPTSAVAPTFAPPPRPDGQINNLGNIQTTMNDAAPTPAPTSAPVRRQRVLPRNYLKVVSLFDGISCGRVALERQGFNVDYYASEIDKHAIEVSDKNGYSVRFGDVRSVKFIPNVDLLIGGSPCQDLSIAKHGRKGLDGDRSGLFWEYLRILRLLKPKWFILENVNSMAKADKDIITREMGVEPIMIDAALVSAQSRKRLFWTNIPVVGLPVDRGIRVKDILEPDAEEDERMTTKDGKAFCLKARYSGATEKHSVETKQSTMVKFTPSKKKFTDTTKKLGYVGEHDHQANRVYDEDGKAPAINTLSANGLIKIGYIGEGEQNGQGGQAHRVYSTDGKTPTLGSSGCGLIQEETKIRKLTPLECERLQGLPDNYTEGVATTHRYKCLGNAFNVDVIAFIVSFIHTADGSAV
jgi:DNA (cytosine-5)-methyltransferase 3A